MEGLRPNRDFKITNKEKASKPAEVLDLNSSTEFTEPTPEDIKQNIFSEFTYLRGSLLKLRLQGKGGTQEYSDLFKRLKEVDKKLPNKPDIYKIGSLEVGLESEYFAAKKLIEALKENEHLCVSYNLDAEAKTDLIKVVLSEDRKFLEEVYLLQIKSNKDTLADDTAILDSQKRYLRSSFSNEVENLEKHREDTFLTDFGVSFSEKLLNKFQRGGKVTKMESQEIFIHHRDSLEENNNLINAKKFFSQAVVIERDGYDKPAGINLYEAKEIFPSESLELKNDLLNLDLEIAKISAKIEKAKALSKQSKGPDFTKKLDFFRAKREVKERRLKELEESNKI
ncbi:hypothetical protein SDC9_33237 [bioreactor metagenome]|uniref:Uncharacterized protein n=1 Tax=bioreactor metagenome TaxID=1076179 RepID=A0A644V7C8_9ZZZZ|nr:hypothetical protein [Candidatus Elulimicrobiales bacterium]